MLLKMTTGLSGPCLNLAPGDYYECSDEEAGRLISAGFAARADDSAKRPNKKSKTNVVSADGDGPAGG